MKREHGRRGLRRLSAQAVVVVIVAASATMTTLPAAADPPATGTPVVNETFHGASVADDAWKALGDACLTGATAGSVPPSGAAAIGNCAAHQSGPVPTVGAIDGYLQLTDTGFSRAGSVLYDRPIPASAGLSVTFDQYQYGGNGADGIGFFLVDGSTTLNKIGGAGGSLGYAQFVNGQAGIPGGYLGVGLDAYGNFYSDADGRGTGCPAGARSPSTWSGPAAPNVITVRGPGAGSSGYCWLGSTIPDPVTNIYAPGTTLNGGTGTLRGGTRAAAERTVNITVDPSSAPNPQLRVQVRYTPGGPWVPELTIPAPATTPATFKLGFSGSTGYSQDVHLLRNVTVQSVVPLPDLVLEKQVDRSGAPLPAVISTGTTIPYVYTVTDTGGPVENLRIDDDRISDVTCEKASLDGTVAPDTTTCRGSYTVTAADTADGTVTNVATASARDGGDTTVRSAEKSVTVPLTSALTMQKSVTTSGPYRLGQQVDYRYVVTNTGGSTLNDVTIDDDKIPAGDVRCPETTLVPRAVVTCTGSNVIAPADLDDDGNLVNTALARSDTAIGQTVTSPRRTVTIPVAVDVALTKTVDNSDATVGDTISFTVTAVNNGPAAATGLEVTDTLPGTGPDQRFVFTRATTTGGTYDPDTGAWSIPRLPNGSTVQLLITGRVGSSASFTNSASVSALDQPDRDPSNDRAAATVNPAPNSADIAVSKVVDSAEVPVGEVARFTLTATNRGPSPASDVSISDTLPRGLSYLAAQSSGAGSYDPTTGIWTVGNLPAGSTVTRTIAVTAADLGTYANLARLRPGSAPDDPDPSNDTASADLHVIRASTDLAVVKSVSTTDTVVGDEVTFHLVASNAGPRTAREVSVIDVLPDGLDVTSASTDTGTISDDAASWSIGTLNAGGPVAQATVTATLTRTGTLINTATVGSPLVTDTDPSNNSASASVNTAAPPVDIAVQKTATVPSGAPLDDVPVGATVAFTLTATNASSTATATGIVLADSLPAGLRFVGSDGDGDYDASAGTWRIPSLTPGGVATRTVEAEVTAAGDFLNTLSLASLDQTDTNPGNNSATVGGTGTVTANLAITKTASQPVVRKDDPVTYTVTVRNNGPNTATGVTAADPALPPDAVVRVTQGTWDPDSGFWTIGDLPNADTATLTVTMTVTTIGQQQNTAAVVGFGQPDPDLSDNIATADLYVPSADIIVTKAVDDPHPSVGQTVTFVVGITNAGPDASATVDLDDQLPAGLDLVSATATTGVYDPNSGIWTLPDLEPQGGTGAEAQEELTVRARVTDVGRIVNTATADRGAAFAVDPDLANNTAESILVTEPATAELHLTKTVLAGGAVDAPVTYRITVTNTGAAPAENVTIRDALPAGLAKPTASSSACARAGTTVLCQAGTIAPGDRFTFTLRATATTTGTIENRASATTTSPLSAASTLTASATLTVVGTSTTVTIRPPADASAPAPGGLATTGAPVWLFTLALFGALLLILGTSLLAANGRRKDTDPAHQPGE